MSQASDSVLEAIKGYIRTEIEGHQFYRMAAMKTDDARGKKMFESLANDEADHARKLYGEFSSVSKTGHWLPEAELSRESAQTFEAFAPMFPLDEEQIAQMVSKATSDLDALRIAIDMEKESIERYSRAASEIADANAKTLFQHLVKEERQHLKLVQNSYDYLSDTGSWFQDLEKPIFEG